MVFLGIFNFKSLKAKVHRERQNTVSFNKRLGYQRTMSLPNSSFDYYEVTTDSYFVKAQPFRVHAMKFLGAQTIIEWDHSGDEVLKNNLPSLHLSKARLGENLTIRK